jgi:hypothetical protein
MARRSFVLAGSRSDADNKTSWEPRVDKDPFHRTMDIFNGVFKKKIKLSAGDSNRTDLHTIWVNFGELTPSRIIQYLRSGSDDDHAVFLLECGHEWEGRRLQKNGLPKALGRDYGMCANCGTDMIYRGFEHEWQHIIFKSDLAARKIFVEQYVEQLLKQAPGVDRKQLTDFLHLLVNAFDDIRVNSLWEKVYPGSAVAIWERWRYLVYKMGDTVNTSFLAFIFAVVFNIPTNPQCEFEPMRPIIEWAIDRVKYRGFNNMLLDVRVVMDRCMGALLAKMQPPPSLQPPSPTTPPPQDPNDQDQEENQAGQPCQEQDPSSDQEEGEGQKAPEVGPQPQGPSSSGTDQGGQEEDGLGQIPSAQAVPADENERSDALSKLIQDPKALDSKEAHMDPTPEDLDKAQKSQALRAALNNVLHQNISDLDNLSAASPDGEPDADMQAQISQLQNGMTDKSQTSQLTDGAKAKVTIIDVTPEGTGDALVVLDEKERTDVQHLRASFFRAMGKQKAKRSTEGTAVDVESVIQYLVDRQDPDVFENQDVNRGFAYSVLCDMSGSMMGSFPLVCKAVEMLKQALDFPFVVGNLWGFRGGEPMTTKAIASWMKSGEVWLYRYHHDVSWYTGSMPYQLYPGPNGIIQVPVQCGGITPMNSAINVVTGHLWRKMPAGMAKRMFLLTDGSPVQDKVTGRPLSEFILRQFVASEIKKARRHGIEVYTIVIGENAISDDKCLQMFGPRRFWARVGKARVGKVLCKLVLENFNGYLRRS